MEIIIQKLKAIEETIAKQEILHKEWLDIKEASAYLNLSTSALYKLTSSKVLPHYVPGGKKIYFRKSELNNWIAAGKVSSVEEFDQEIEKYLSRPAKSQV